MAVQRILRCRAKRLGQGSFQIAEKAHQRRVMLVQLPVDRLRFIQCRYQNPAQDIALFITEQRLQRVCVDAKAPIERANHFRNVGARKGRRASVISLSYSASPRNARTPPCRL